MAKPIDLHFCLLNTLMLALLTASTAGSSNAKDPFYPCQSSTGGTVIYSVECQNITVKRVKTAFEKSKIHLNIGQFILKLENNKDEKIPSNFIGNNSISMITLQCSDRNSPLRVDSAAFSVTKSVTSSLNIYKCNLKYLNWSFLKGFSKLGTLYIYDSMNLHQTFYTLPTTSLVNLNTVSFNSVMGLNGFNKTCLKFPAPPPNGLSYFELKQCYDLGSSAVQNILAKWVRPTSTNTLITLDLSYNTLTSIPPEISKFNQLEVLDLSGQKQPWILQSGSFNFKNPVRTIALGSSRITSISPGAFQGNYGATLVDLSYNNLTTFNAGVFQNMLLQMQTSSGFLTTLGNPFDCSFKNQCNLTWLIRDNPNYLTCADPRGACVQAQCSNGTYFYDLDSSKLRSPNGKRCP